MASSPSHFQRNKAPAPFIQPWDRQEVAAKMAEQKFRLSKSSINFGDKTCDWNTTLRPDMSKGPAYKHSFPAVGQAAGITYNASTSAYKNSSNVSLGSDAIVYGTSNVMPNLQQTHPDWDDYRGKKDVVFSGLIRKSSIRLGSEEWFYKKSTMREMLEESAKGCYAVDVHARAAQKTKNEEVKKALRRSQIVLGSDETEYHRSNAMPWFSGEVVSSNKYTIDPNIAKGLRKTNFVMGDDRLMERQSCMSSQFPVWKNDTDFVAIKKKQKELVTQLRSTQIQLGDGSPTNYKKTSEMKNWYLPETYERPRTPAL
jgi:hypothetical protein